MTITTTTTFEEYDADGVTTVFAVSFQFLASNTLRVYTVTDGVPTLKSEGVDYSVTGGEGSTGSVVFGEAPVDGDKVQIYRDNGGIQTDDFVNNAALNAPVIEAALDKAYMILQEVASRVGGIDFAVGNTGFLPRSAADLDNWDAQSGQIKNVADPTAGTDAANKSYADGIATSSGNVPNPGVGELDYVLVANPLAEANPFRWEQFSAANIDNAGTAAEKNHGTASGEVPLLGSGGKLAASMIPTGTTDGDIVAVGSGDLIPGSIIPFASVSDVNAGTEDDEAIAPNTLKKFSGGYAAWAIVDTNSPGTPIDSYGIASISTSGTGRLDVTLSEAMSDTDYAVVGSGLSGSPRVAYMFSVTSTTVCQVRISNMAGSDVHDTKVFFGIIGTRS